MQNETRLDRAKQFLPFDALDGFRELLKKAEVEIEEKRDLSEESLSALEKEFNKMEVNSMIKVNYYNYQLKKYVEISGIVTEINRIKKKITIDKERNINISDIQSLEVI